MVFGGPQPPPNPLPGAQNRPPGPRNGVPKPIRSIPGWAKIFKTCTKIKIEPKGQVRKRITEIEFFGPPGDRFRGGGPSGGPGLGPVWDQTLVRERSLSGPSRPKTVYKNRFLAIKGVFRSGSVGESTRPAGLTEH